jgi:uncharacterized protein
MLWRGREGSSNVEDRRGVSGGGIAVGGGIGGLIIGLLYFLLGGDPSQAPQLPGGQGSSTQYSAEQKASDDTLAQFVGVVLKDTEDVWGELMRNYQKRHVAARVRPLVHSIAPEIKRFTLTFLFLRI